MNEHPSFFALDALRLGAPASPEVAGHVAGCARCQALVEARVEEPPAWLAGMSVRPGRRRLRAAYVTPLVGVAAAAAIVLLLVRPPPAEPPAHGTREKGAPAVEVLVKRGEVVSIWDGRSPVRPGDSIGLRVVGAGAYRHLSIAAASRGAFTVLHQQPLGGAGNVLVPMSFRVDDQGSEEVLSVVLGRAPVDPRLHGRADDPDRERDHHRQIIVFRKEPAGAGPQLQGDRP